MDRALNRDLLAGALGDTPNLPTPEQLAGLLAEAEVSSFFGEPGQVGQDLLDIAWTLHHAGTARPALQLYDPVQQVQANAVAAHVFDLALGDPNLDSDVQLVLTFAAQVSAIRGDRTPNASALGARLPPAQPAMTAPGRTSLQVGCTFLSLQRRRTLELLRQLPTSEPTDQAPSVLDAVRGVIDGVRLLQRYLSNGDSGDLGLARSLFEGAAVSVMARHDLDSRWVAAHLADLCDDLGRSAVWALLPAGTPPAVGKAMAFGDPPVTSLWPPQVELLSGEGPNPLDPAVTRVVLTFPTSAGKTLLSQLVIAYHLATVGTGVCFVAPSHSLCREVREGLSRRLWAVRRHVADDGPLGDPSEANAPVVVMTPERFAARLRNDEQALLAEFGLFVFDEAHLVNDESRGWTFESSVSRLHQLTSGSHHKLILISAALGGTASVQAWLDTGAPHVTEASTWRGPRRLYATYETAEDVTSRREEPPAGRQRLPRQITDLRGIVRLYVGEGDAVASRSTVLGEIVRAGTQTIRPSVAGRLAPIIELAAYAGPVLTVHATKVNAERQASEVAARREEHPPASALVRLAEDRLGITHPLVAILRRGVAYHHAALPTDVQTEIEAGVRSGAIEILCATTTVTEGINLPFRTVIVCERGFYDGAEFHEFISAADLLNAAGRAGRAGRETEGWVVVAQQAYATSPRDAIRGLDVHEDLRSTLVTTAAVAALAEYEAVVHATAGIVFTDVPDVVDGFLAYCWYLADAADVLDPAARAQTVIAGIQQTLAWQQLSPDLRARWEALAARTSASFEVSDPVQRSRWAKSGTGLSANVVLDAVAASARSMLENVDPDQAADPVTVLGILIGDGRLGQLLALADERSYRFKRRRYGPTEPVEVDLSNLILDWVRGMPLAELADRYLSDVDSHTEQQEGFRFEQLSAFLTAICEHHLPWTLGTVLAWLNEDRTTPLCPQLAAFLHYGVPVPQSLELMANGVRSRRLAVLVGVEAAANGVVSEQLRSWITDLGPGVWSAEFQTGAAEANDLLEFVHDPTAQLGAQLLDGGTVEMTVHATAEEWPAGVNLRIAQMVGAVGPRLLAVVDSDGAPLAEVSAADHHHLTTLLEAGFQLVANPLGTAEEHSRTITLHAISD